MKTKIKPCPFCGGEASVYLFYNSGFRAICTACGASAGRTRATSEDAADDWNSRVRESSLENENKAYRDFLRRLSHDIRNDAGWPMGIDLRWVVQRIAELGV